MALPPKTESSTDPGFTLDLSGRPRPLLSRRTEMELSARHREVLDQLETLMVAEEFGSMTVARLAAAVGCSRRTLYELAPSKNELVLVILDRLLHRMGRAGLEAVTPAGDFAGRIRAYFGAGLELQRRTATFAEKLADDHAARRLLDRHFQFALSVVEQLVASGVASGEFRPVPAPLVAGLLLGGGLYVSQPHLRARIGLSQAESADQIVDLVLRSLTRD